MPDPRSCQLRKTKPMGPMTLCSDLECFKKCVELTRKERREVAEIES